MMGEGKQKFRVPRAAAERMMKVIECISECPEGEATIEKITKYVHATPKVSDALVAQMRQAVVAALELELVGEGSIQWTYRIADTSVAKQFPYYDEGTKRNYFRSALQRYPPFLKFLHFLRQGDGVTAAARTAILLGIDKKPELLHTILRGWGIYAGILRKKGQETLVVEKLEEVKPARVVDISQALDDEIKAREYLMWVLGDDPYESLSQEEADDLVTALVNYEDDPGDSIFRAGRVLEDYLKTVARERKVDLGKATQLRGIAEKLRAQGVIASKHVNILRGLEVFIHQDVMNGLAAYRHMRGHGKDSKETKATGLEQRWSLSPEIALTHVLQCILTIKSLWYYAAKGKLVY